MNRLLASSSLTRGWLKNKNYEKQCDANDLLGRQELEDIQKYLNRIESRLVSRQFNVGTFQIRLAELGSTISRLVELNPKNNALWPLIAKTVWLEGIIRNAIEPYPVMPDFKETLVDVASTVDALFYEKNNKTKLDEYGKKFHDMGAGWQLILIPQREKLIERDCWLLIIIHDWLLPDCEPIDQNRTLMRLGNLGFFVDLLLINKNRDGLGIIKRALNHVQQHLSEQPTKDTVTNAAQQVPTTKKASGGGNAEGKKSRPPVKKIIKVILADQPELKNKPTNLLPLVNAELKRLDRTPVKIESVKNALSKIRLNKK